MPDGNPFFSILIPAYNRPEELRQCIGSIISGSFKDYEIIVSDDNSPKKNEIEEVIKSFGSDENIYFFQQSTNLKEPGNKNFLVNKANGQFNIVLGDDDTLAEDALSYIFNFISIEPESDIYGFGYRIVDEDGLPLSVYRSSRSVQLDNDVSRLKLLEAGLLPMALFHPATFCCRSGVEKSFPYSAQVGIGEDLFFLLEAVLNNCSITVIPKVIFNWRKVQNIDSIKQGNQSAEYLASFRAKLMMHERLMSYADVPQLISEHIRTINYRFNFLYIELLRDTGVSDSIGYEMDIEMANEYFYVKNSFIWRLKAIFIRVFRMFDLISIIGLTHTIIIIFDKYLNGKRLSSDD